jgi:hypothetical protein
MSEIALMEFATGIVRNMALNWGQIWYDEGNSRNETTKGEASH